jgi:KDO2-lipid IV(A) lauroyltransferase
MQKKRRGRIFRPTYDAIIGRMAVNLLLLFRLIDRKKLANFLGRIMRAIGPWLPRHQLGRANLAAAFPDLTEAQINSILGEVWDNLGRVAAEFAHLDQIRIAKAEDEYADADGVIDRHAVNILERTRQNPESTVFFAAHLANWELPALVPPLFGVDSYVLYRRPNIGLIGDAIRQIRGRCMGTLVAADFVAAARLALALRQGALAGMLIDQQYRRGVDVTFFGRTCKANPLIAKLADQFDCPIRGIRVVRLDDRNTFWGDVTEPIEVSRRADGGIDIQQTMQTITAVVEEWVRQRPGQWLWLHDRWR